MQDEKVQFTRMFGQEIKEDPSKFISKFNLLSCIFDKWQTQVLGFFAHTIFVHYILIPPFCLSPNRFWF